MSNKYSEGLVYFDWADLFQFLSFTEFVFYCKFHVLVLWVLKLLSTPVIPREGDRIYELFIWSYGSSGGFYSYFPSINGFLNADINIINSYFILC